MRDHQLAILASAMVALAAVCPLDLLAAQNCLSPSNVGFKIIAVPDGPKMAIWYPTDAPESPFSYSKDIHSMLARDAAISTCRRFPLVVFSHGLGGCGTQSIFITEELARKGYVVAAPDHRDATCHVDGSGAFALRSPQESFFKPETWTESTYLDRQRDIEDVINWVLKSAEFSRGVDPNSIGAAGHSIGGYVVLGMVGGWKSWKDPRIKAALLFSPYALPYSVRNLLQQIDVPIMYQGAQLDLGITPFLQGKTGAYAGTKSKKFFVELKGGSHFEWTNLLCLGSNTIANCVASKPNAHLILSYSEMFLDRSLKGDPKAGADLHGFGLLAYEHN